MANLHVLWRVHAKNWWAFFNKYFRRKINTEVGELIQESSHPQRVVDRLRHSLDLHEALDCVEDVTERYVSILLYVLSSSRAVGSLRAQIPNVMAQTKPGTEGKAITQVWYYWSYSKVQKYSTIKIWRLKGWEFW